MEVRDTVHSPPFWASPSNASNPSPSSPYSTSRSTQSGIKPLLFVLVFSIAVLLFLPSILSSPFKNPRSSLSIKSGWDMLNLCLVAFAILCGVLSRTGDGSGSGSESGSFKQVRGEWSGFANPMGEVNRTTTIRRMRSTNSYPDLRQETDVWGQNRVPDGWRFFDDAELYRTRRPVQPYRVVGFEEERECKTIPVDTERLPLMEEQVEEIEANFEEGKAILSDTSYEEEKKGREAMEVRWQRRSLEALPRIEEVEKESMVVAGRRRRRSLEGFPLVEEVERETNFEKVGEEKVQKRQMVVRRRRKSSETFPKMEEIERETRVEEEMVEKPREVVTKRRTKSLELFPEIEQVEKETNFGETMVEKPPLVVEVTPPPPPPPPPPPLQETKVTDECRKHKRSGSGGGTKDLASAIALFYQKKKKGNKSKRKEKQEVPIDANVVDNNSTTESNTNPSCSIPPPPPPPPPASIFHQLFSNKKGGSKSRKIHSLSASTHSNSPSTVNIVTTPTTQPPPLNPRSHRSRKDQIELSGYTRIEDSELYIQHRRRERSNLSPYAKYPLPPRSPLPPPPPPPPAVREIVSESRAQEEQKSGSVAVFCASPDVNDKADLFIQRFRAGLKLEKINSIREKEIRKGRREREEEIGGEDDGRHI